MIFLSTGMSSEAIAIPTSSGPSTPFLSLSTSRKASCAHPASHSVARRSKRVRGEGAGSRQGRKETLSWLNLAKFLSWKYF